MSKYLIYFKLKIACFSLPSELLFKMFFSPPKWYRVIEENKK